VPRIAPALKELVEGRTTEVLSTLENIFLEGFQPLGPFHDAVVRKQTFLLHDDLVCRKPIVL
jgi:hypothetical protein